MSGYQSLEENLNELLNDLSRLQEEEEQKNKQVEELRSKLGEALQLIDAAGAYAVDQRLSTMDSEQLNSQGLSEAQQAELKAKDKIIKELTEELETLKNQGNAQGNTEGEDAEKQLKERIQDQEDQLAHSDKLRQQLAHKLQIQVANNDDLLDEIDRLVNENKKLKQEIEQLKAAAGQEGEPAPQAETEANPEGEQKEEGEPVTQDLPDPNEQPAE